MAGSVAARAVLPVTGDCAVDDAGVDGLHGLITHAQLVKHARAEAFEHNISVLDEVKQYFLASLLL